MRPNDVLDRTVKEYLRVLGKNLRVARQRRNSPIDEWAQRLVCAPSTVKRMEAGDPGVAMGTYVAALFFIRAELPRDFVNLIDPAVDIEGRTLEAAGRRKRIRRAATKTDYIFAGT